MRLQYTVRNLDVTNAMAPITGPWGMWSQVYLRSGGVELDNIPQYGRFHQQYVWNHLSQLEQFGEAGISGFGGFASAANVPLNRPDYGGINPNQAYTVMHKMHLSIFFE